MTARRCAFFDALGEERCKQIELVSADMAGWISGPITERAPQAVRCVDPFHLVMLATDALDEVRREVWNEARRQGNLQLARDLKGARFAVWKNPENLTDRQAAKLATIQHTNARLYRAYLLKEQLRQIYQLPAVAAEQLLDRWLAWARRYRLPSFVKLARTITDQRDGILAAIHHGLSNARLEQINTQIRLIARRAFGFHSRSAHRAGNAQARGPLPAATAVTQPTETSGEGQNAVHFEPLKSVVSARGGHHEKAASLSSEQPSRIDAELSSRPADADTTGHADASCGTRPSAQAGLPSPDDGGRKIATSARDAPPTDRSNRCSGH